MRLLTTSTERKRPSAPASPARPAASAPAPRRSPRRSAACSAPTARSSPTPPAPSAWRPAGRPAPRRKARPGWFAATADAVEALGETAAHLDALADAQPPGSAAHELGADIATFLRDRRDTLLADIARLVD